MIHTKILGLALEVLRTGTATEKVPLPISNLPIYISTLSLKLNSAPGTDKRHVGFASAVYDAVL